MAHNAATPCNTSKILIARGIQQEASIAFIEEIQQLLQIMASAARIADAHWLSSSEIENIALHCFGLDLRRQRILPTLKRARGLVAVRKGKDGNRFKLLAAGFQAIQGSENDPILIMPENAFTGKRKVQEIFGNLSGEVSICDPYLDPSSLDFVSRIGSGNSVRLLTMKVQSQPEFLRDLRALESEHRSIEVRQASGKLLHDRYLIDRESLYFLGTSLNGLGKKTSMVVSLGADFRRSMLEVFDKAWSGGRVL